MNRSVRGIAAMFLKDTRPSVIIFWTILFTVYALMLLLMLRLGGGEATSGGVSPLYIYMLVLGIVGVPGTLPYALGMCVRRVDYYAGIVLGGLGVAAASAAALTILAALEQVWVAALPVRFTFFSMPAFSGVAFFGEWAAQFVFLTFMFSLGFAIALWYRRFGATGMYLLAAAALAGVLAVHLLNGWSAVLRWLLPLGGVLPFTLGAIAATLLLQLVSFALIRKVTV